MFSGKPLSAMPSKELEKYLKNAPAHELETIDKSGQTLADNKAQVQEYNGETPAPQHIMQGKSDPTPPKEQETTPTNSKQLNAVDRALDAGTKKETIDQGQSLDKSGAKLEQENGLER